MLFKTLFFFVCHYTSIIWWERCAHDEGTGDVVRVHAAGTKLIFHVDGHFQHLPTSGKERDYDRDRHSHKRERERAYLLGFIEIDIAAMLAEEVSSDSRLETNCGSDIQSNDKGWRG